MAPPTTHSSSGFWLHDSPLLLASASPARLEMLHRSGLPVDVCPARIDERAVEAEHGGLQTDIARVLARTKSLNVSARFPDRLVLGADQTLHCEGLSFHKPVHRDAARQQLMSLAGKEHVLTSAFCLARSGHVLAEGTSSAKLRMRSLTAGFLALYLDVAGEGALGSVGCYQLEGVGSQLFTSVDGDHFTILGLPLLEVLATLRQLGVLAE
ncbi:MAG: Maf family protein [Bosea sp. (in: a-proteobacteria)]